MPTDQEARFTRALLKVIARARKDVLFEPPRLREMISQQGGVAAVRSLLGFGAVHTGFTSLWERGRLDLTAEFLVLQPPWSALFTAAELRTARRRLLDYGVASADLPEELPDRASPAAPPPPAALASATVRGVPPNPPSPDPSPSITRSARAAEPVGAYAHARRAGNLLFLSGVGPRLRGSRDIPGVRLAADGTVASYDIEAQIRSCFENVRLILEDSGASWDCIIDVTVFLTDMNRDFAVYNRVYAEFFPPGPTQPCRTTVQVGALPQAGSAPINFEVKVIAQVG